MRGSPQPATPSDADLLSSLERGEVEALALLYDRYGPYVLALAWRVLGERSDAEEVVQDVFWQLWSGGIRYEASRGRFATWLYTVARNRSIDRVRRRETARRVISDGIPPEPLAPSSPEAQLEQSERRAFLQSALARLSTDQRHALTLCFYDGLSHREVSELLHTPLGTIKSRIRSALIALRNALEMGDE